MPPPIWLGDDPKYSMPAFLFRWTQYMRFRLNKDERKMHESAVFFALTSTQNGKIVSWYSKERLVAGKVRVIHSYPISGGYCRTYQAYIKINTKDKTKSLETLHKSDIDKIITTKRRFKSNDQKIIRIESRIGFSMQISIFL